jgi:hypothetical protein
MLIIEHHPDGHRFVRFDRDWTPVRIGAAYSPTQPMPDYTNGRDALRLQAALVREWVARHGRR